jgi:hypothetical protein
MVAGGWHAAIALPPPDRTLFLWPRDDAHSKVGRLAAMPLRWPDQPAASVLDYAVNAGALLESATDALTATVIAATMTLVAQTIVGGVLVLWLANGAPGIDNPIDLHLSTASGRYVRRIARLQTL